MVNFYSSPLTYGQQSVPLTYENSPVQSEYSALQNNSTQNTNMMQQQYNNVETMAQSYNNSSSSLPAATTGLVLGGIGGVIIGARKNPNISKNGVISDTFVKNSYENYIKRVPDAGKEAYEQGLNILKKIDGVKNQGELKTLLGNNSKAAELVCAELHEGPESFLENITHKNLKANKKTIKEKLTAGNKIRFQNMKNLIESCWDSEKKKLVQPEGMEKDMFKAIKKAANAGRGKIVAKYAAITAAIGGAVGFIAHKFLSAKNNIQPQQFS